MTTMPDGRLAEDPAVSKAEGLNSVLFPIDQSPTHRTGEDIRFPGAVQVNGHTPGHRRARPGQSGLCYETESCARTPSAIEHRADCFAPHAEIESAEP